LWRSPKDEEPAKKKKAKTYSRGTVGYMEMAASERRTCREDQDLLLKTPGWGGGDLWEIAKKHHRRPAIARA